MEVSVGSLDLPDQPDEPRRVERADEDRLKPEPRQMPDPDERGRYYEAMHAHVSAKTAEEASPGQRPDGTDQRSYRDEVPRFVGLRTDQAKCWPAEQRAAADRSADPPGSYRSDGGLYLNPERHAEAVRAIGRVRLKGEDRLKEKVAERLEGEPDKTPAEILRKVPDAIRYTFCVRPETYTPGYYDIKDRLESRGYEMYESRNSWDGAEYKGINTRWVTPEGQRFEVQFHTPESFHAKQFVTHGVYERIRNPLVSDKERAELKAFQREVCSHIWVPDGARGIPDFKKEGF